MFQPACGIFHPLCGLQDPLCWLLHPLTLISTGEDEDKETRRNAKELGQRERRTQRQKSRRRIRTKN